MEQTFRLVIISTMVISRWKNQWYIVSQLLLEQNIWQAWSLVLLPNKLSDLLIFFISLKLQKLLQKFKFLWYVTFRSRHVGHLAYSFINMLFISTGIYDDKLHPQILSVGIIVNASLITYYFIIHHFNWFLCWIVLHLQYTLHQN